MELHIGATGPDFAKQGSCSGMNQKSCRAGGAVRVMLELHCWVSRWGCIAGSHNRAALLGLTLGLH